MMVPPLPGYVSNHVLRAAARIPARARGNPRAAYIPSAVVVRPTLIRAGRVLAQKGLEPELLHLDIPDKKGNTAAEIMLRKMGPDFHKMAGQPG